MLNRQEKTGEGGQAPHTERMKIYLAELGEKADSSVQGGTRPVIVLQNNAGNRSSPTVIVAPITSKLEKPHLPTHVVLVQSNLPKQSMVLLEQVQTVNKEDLKDYIGTVDDEQLIRRINTMLKKTFGLWIYKKEKEENIRCLCPKCLSEYIDNPNYIVRRLDPFAKEKDRCDKCDKSGWDYVVTEINSVRKGKSGSYE